MHGSGLRAAGSLADIKLVPVAQSAQSSSSAVHNLPLVVNCFDDEAKSWADSINVLSHNSLDYCRLPSVIEAPERYQLRLKVCCQLPYSIRTLISLSFNLAFRSIDSILFVG